MADEPGLSSNPLIPDDAPWTAGYSKLNSVEGTHLGSKRERTPDEIRRDEISMKRAELNAVWDLYVNTPPSQERLEYRDTAIKLQRELIALGEPEDAINREYPVEPEQSDKAKADKAKPTYKWLVDYYRAQGGIEGKDPSQFDQETLQRVYDLEHSTEEQTANEPYDDTINDFNAGTAGPSEEWLKAQRANQEQKKADQEERDAKLAADAEKVRQQRKADQDERDAKRAAEAEQKRQQRQQDQAAREQRNAQSAQQQQQQAALRAQKQKQSVHRQLALQTTQAAIGAINDTKVTLGNLPQPGGIGVMLIVIIFMLLAIAPMNGAGDTRLQLLWLSFWGKTSLPTSFQDKFGGSDTAAVAAAIAAGIKTGLNATDTSTGSDTAADAGSGTVSPLGSALDVGNMLPFASGGF